MKPRPPIHRHAGLPASLLMLLIGFTLPAADRVAVSAPEQLTTGRAGLTITAAADGGGVFAAAGGGAAFSNDVIPVDPAKRYRLSGEFRNVSAAPLQLSFGVNCRDAKTNIIYGHNVDAIPGTETVLAGNYEKGSNVIRVRDASNWSAGKHVAFRIAAGGKLTDLPNFITQSRVREITPDADGNCYVVRLAPVQQRTFKTGGRVRLHDPGPTFHYAVLNTELPPGEWRRFEAEYHGISTGPTEPGKFRTGTATAGLAVAFNPAKKPDAVIEFRNLKLETPE